MTPEELRAIGSEIILGNAFHLMLRPGVEVISQHGGLHGFMHWDAPILTDSGGFQVFSLAGSRKISEEGVQFRSPVNGDPVFLGPEKSIEVQHALNSDIVMRALFRGSGPGAGIDGALATLGATQQNSPW